MAKVYTVRYLMDDETATYLPSHALKKGKRMKKRNKKKKKKRKDEVEKKKIMKSNGNTAFSQIGPRKRQAKTSSFMLCL